jgi:hypothetical protein
MVASGSVSFKIRDRLKRMRARIAQQWKAALLTEEYF